MKWRRAWESNRVKLPEEDEDKREPEMESESDGEAVVGRGRTISKEMRLGTLAILRALLADVDRGGIMVAFRCGKVMS